MIKYLPYARRAGDLTLLSLFFPLSKAGACQALLTPFAASREQKCFPFLHSHLAGKAKGSKLGHQPSAAAREGRGGLQPGVFLSKRCDKKQSPREDKLVCFISRPRINPGLLSLLSLTCWHVETASCLVRSRVLLRG